MWGFHIFCAQKLRPSAPYIILKGIISLKVVFFPESTRLHVSSLEFYRMACELLKFYHARPGRTQLHPFVLKFYHGARASPWASTFPFSRRPPADGQRMGKGKGKGERGEGKGKQKCQKANMKEQHEPA